MKKILVIVFFFSSFLFSLSAKENKLKGCNGKISKSFIHNNEEIPIKSIEVDTNNYRKWTLNGIRILTSRYRYVDDRYKKRFDSKVTVTYLDNTICIFDARIRHSGDEKDHISLLENSITQSLDVHLKNGNIRGITKFKLLRPKARGILEDEIFLTEILRNLNYIAPRTIKVNTRVNRIKTVMLFQEKAAKEMLEFNNRREGPFFEGDERFFFKKADELEDNQLSGWSMGVVDIMNQNAKFMLAKQINSELVLKSNGHKLMSIDATSKLNMIYLYFASRFQDSLNNFNYMEYDLDNSLLALFDKEKTSKLDEYNLLIEAVNGHHGLAVNNRKFFWNSIENYFEPINYDSNANISLDIPLNQVRLPISEEFLKSFSSLKLRLGNLNVKKIQDNLQLSGLNFNEQKINEKIKKIIKNINQLEKNYNNLDQSIIEHNEFKNDDKIVNNYKENLKKSEINVTLINYNSNNQKFNRCKNFLEDCEFYDISNENLSNLLQGELSFKDQFYQYLGSNLNFKAFHSNNFKNSSSIENTKIFYDDGIEFTYDKINNELIINQILPGAKIIFLKGKLNGTKIFFTGIKKTQSNYSATDINGLTGCLTFFDLELNNVKIDANISSCEDAVNFIDVSGKIENINIENSLSDALDVDFSKVKIKNLKVKNAGNDCADFSYGEYKLNNLQLEKCGDKGLSIGEKSYVELNKIDVKNAVTGVASKDSSFTIINNSLFKNINTCISAYKKKQEFDGSIIEIDNLICKNYQQKLSADSRSKIFKRK